MRQRSALRLGALAALAVVGMSAPIGLKGAQAITTANENARTVVVSLPGPFSGCTFLDGPPGASGNAILDLIRPSAFQTTPGGNLVGEGGAIVAAELTSLQPETVRYTLAPDLHWSNGALFRGSDLVAWWSRAKRRASVLSDGYRAIRSLAVTGGGLTVTATFATSYADWNLLFRDIEERGVAGGCSVGKLVSNPSLGPYKVLSASSSRVVLVMNRHWPLWPNRFGRVIITSSPTPAKSPASIFAGYSLNVSKNYVESLSSYPTLSNRIGISSSIEELTFAPRGVETRRILVRRALSWSLNRQAMINSLWGSVTYSPSVAQSALFSQGQSAYPGGGGTSPVGQATTTTAPTVATHGLGDCFSCAVVVLKSAGFSRNPTGWFDAHGKQLTVQIAVGPSGLDRAAAKLVVNAWRHLGVASTVTQESSDLKASVASATNTVDVAIFARPTTTAASTTARSWSGPGYFDSYPSGVRMARVNSLFAQAIATFNSVTANGIWLALDRVLLNAYWVRPFFTAPTVLSWTSSLSNVQTSVLIAGFVDEVPTWSRVALASSS